VREGTTSRAQARDAYEVLEVRPDASQVVVNAAFRALAAVHHPDASGGTNRRMAELNAAYALVRTPDLRAAYDRLRERGGATAVVRVQDAAAPSTGGASPSQPKEHGQSHSDAQKKRGVIDFGRYEGWSIGDLARRDPDYLRWLRRHSSGIRFRHEIDAALTAVDQASPGSSQQERRRRR
jgi:curved DNA-binding protein CbpA